MQKDEGSRKHEAGLVSRAAAKIQTLGFPTPPLAIVMGSGFQNLGEDWQEQAELVYGKIPGFEKVTVAGHEGRLRLGTLAGRNLLILCGRTHYYEGHSIETVTFPMRVLAALGIRHVLLTNAAGGIHSRFRPGDFMGLRDHINFMGCSPLRGSVGHGGERFVDLSDTYDQDLRKLLRRAATRLKIRYHEGTYLAVAGPNYETPAEIRAFRSWGADAVGMSTVPEAIVARQCGLSVAGLSCITNWAAGRRAGALSHGEVLRMADRVANTSARLITEFVRLYGLRN